MPTPSHCQKNLPEKLSIDFFGLMCKIIMTELSLQISQIIRNYNKSVRGHHNINLTILPLGINVFMFARLVNAAVFIFAYY